MWGIHRTKSALQVRIIPATLKDIILDSGKTVQEIQRYGSVFFEGANGNDKSYDWSNKCNIAISEGDLAQVFNAFAIYDSTKSIFDKDKNIRKDKKNNPILHGYMNLSLTHDPNAGTDQAGKDLFKTLSITNAPNPGTYFLTITYTKDKKVINRVSVSLSAGDLEKLKFYITSNLNKILGNL